MKLWGPLESVFLLASLSFPSEMRERFFKKHVNGKILSRLNRSRLEYLGITTEQGQNKILDEVSRLKKSKKPDTEASERHGSISASPSELSISPELVPSLSLSRIPKMIRPSGSSHRLSPGTSTPRAGRLDTKPPLSPTSRGNEASEAESAGASEIKKSLKLIFTIDDVIEVVSVRVNPAFVSLESIRQLVTEELLQEELIEKADTPFFIYTLSRGAERFDIDNQDKLTAFIESNSKKRPVAHMCISFKGSTSRTKAVSLIDETTVSDLVGLNLKKKRNLDSQPKSPKRKPTPVRSRGVVLPRSEEKSTLTHLLSGTS
jgi:hypothetical protein